MDSCIQHEEQERSLFPRRIVEVESEEQVRPSLRFVRGRFSHANDREITGCVKILNKGSLTNYVDKILAFVDHPPPMH